MLTIPYVTVAAFRAHPTFIDTLNLRSGDASGPDQDQELRNMLLEASAMADDYVEMGQSALSDGTLQAHTRTENRRLRVDRQGRLKFHPDHKPILAVTALSYGWDTKSLQSVTDLTGLWIEDGNRVVMPLAFTNAMTQIQFGSPAYDSQVYASWTYTAGYVNTLLGGATTQGATSIPILDATGISAGAVLRIWDPGSEEAVTVASTYTPGSLTAPLTAPLQFAHANTVPTGVSGLPPQAHLAVVLYACALLMRPDTEAEDVFPSSKVDPNTSVGTKAGGSGFIVQAEQLLESLRRVR